MKPTSPLLRSIFAALAAFLAFSPLVSANGFQTRYWLGSNGTFWNAGENWSSTPDGTSPANLTPNAYVV